MLVAAGSPDALARPRPHDSPSPEATATPSESPSASPSPQPSPSEDFPEPDKPGFFDLVGKVRYAISQWFSNLVTSALRPVFDFLGHTVFSTPPLADNDRIVQLWGFSLAIADSLLLLLFLAGAGLVTVGGGLGSQLTAKELLPRLVVAAVTANVSLLLLRQLIELSNSLSAALLGASLEPSDVAPADDPDAGGRRTPESISGPARARRDRARDPRGDRLHHPGRGARRPGRRGAAAAHRPHPAADRAIRPSVVASDARALRRSGCAIVAAGRRVPGCCSRAMACALASANATVPGEPPAGKMAKAWARRNCDHVGPIRRGAGLRPPRRSTFAVVVPEVLMP